MCIHHTHVTMYACVMYTHVLNTHTHMHTCITASHYSKPDRQMSYRQTWTYPETYKRTRMHFYPIPGKTQTKTNLHTIHCHPYTTIPYHAAQQGKAGQGTCQHKHAPVPDYMPFHSVASHDAVPLTARKPQVARSFSLMARCLCATSMGRPVYCWGPPMMLQRNWTTRTSERGFTFFCLGWGRGSLKPQPPVALAAPAAAPSDPLRPLDPLHSPCHDLKSPCAPPP